MQISSVAIAILSSVLVLGLPAAVSGHGERFDMVSIVSSDGISLDDRCSPLERRKLRDHIQLAMNAVMMMNRDQVGNLHYDKAMDVEEYYGYRRRHLERIDPSYTTVRTDCACSYQRSFGDPKRPQCRADGTVDMNLMRVCVRGYGFFVYHACHATANGCPRERRNLRSGGDEMLHYKTSGLRDSAGKTGDSTLDLFETIAEQVPERHRHLKRRGEDGHAKRLSIGDLISIQLTELILAEASMDRMYSCLEGVDFDIVVSPNADKLTPENEWD